jgi:thiopeptide-type bacteriocin biosynthesis protein
MDYLGSLCDGLNRDKKIRWEQSYVPNTTIYVAGKKVRYIERRLKEKGRSYHLVTADSIEALHLALDAADRVGGIHPDVVVQRLRAWDSGITEAEAKAFVEELIEGQFLLPRLSPPITGRDPLETLLEDLSGIDRKCEAYLRLESVREQIEVIDSAGLGNEPGSYQKVIEALETLPAQVDPTRIFQVDLARSSPDAVLGEAVVEESQRGVEILHTLFGPSDVDALSPFQRAFYERYERREVALLEALDDERGVGFPASEKPFHADLELPTVPWGPTQSWIAQRLYETVSEGKEEMEIQERDLEPFLQEGELTPLAEALGMTFSLATPSEEACAEGDFRLHLRGMYGPTGSNLLGRFCHLDPEIESLAREHIATEEALHPEAVFCEVVHLPQDRTGNILFRPVFRDFELPILARSGVRKDRQIDLADLTLQVERGRIRLRSRALGREVIPRLTTAHGFSSSGNLNLYRLLCHLQEQGVIHGLGWRWGPLDRLPFLPRVVSGRLVLSLARWNIRTEEILEFTAGTQNEQFEAVQRFRAKRSLPRYVVLSDHDNRLVLDLDHALCVETFCSLVKSRPEAKLQELFPSPEDLCVGGPEGSFVHEMVLPLVRRSKKEAGLESSVEKRQPTSPVENSPRRFSPGSDWAYIKLYAGFAQIDSILIDAVLPFVRETLELQRGERWFFIRYADPESHLRIRFQSDSHRLQTHLLPAFYAHIEEAVAEGQIWRVQLDTYEREVERYGGPVGIPLSEQLFCADSEAVAALVAGLSREKESEDRWYLTLLGMDRLLDDLGYDLAGKMRCVATIRQDFAREFGVETGPGHHQLGKDYRKKRSRIETLLSGNATRNPTLDQSRPHFDRRSRQLNPVVEALRSAEREGELTNSMDDLAASFLHMHANRFVRSATRIQELDFYDSLGRYYESCMARRRSIGKRSD